MSITEYNHEKTMQMLREECYEDGVCRGETQMLVKMLKERGKVPAQLEQQISKETDQNKINQCMKAIMRITTDDVFMIVEEILNK